MTILYKILQKYYRKYIKSLLNAQELCKNPVNIFCKFRLVPEQVAEIFCNHGMFKANQSFNVFSVGSALAYLRDPCRGVATYQRAADQHMKVTSKAGNRPPGIICVRGRGGKISCRPRCAILFKLQNWRRIQEEPQGPVEIPCVGPNRLIKF